MSGSRARLAVGIVAGVAAVAVAVVVIAGGSGGGDEDEPAGTVRSRIVLERFTAPDTGRPELLVSLPEPGLNTPQTTRGATTVLLRCVDASGTETVRRDWDWPLLEEAGYPFPHIHQPVRPRVLDAIRGCRLTGTGIDFAGRAPGGPPPAAAG